MDPAVRIEEVRKSFGSVKAIDGLSLDIPEGSVFGLLGPNGAGKSTTIRMILDIYRPDSGEIRVFGRPAGAAVRAEIGYLPEERGLYRKMKILDILEFLGALKGNSPSASRRSAAEWLERLSLSDRSGSRVEELSKGNQQKVQFIAAVLARPRLLILDEPFSGMDPVNQNLFKDLMLEIHRAGATVIFSTHQMETAERLCDRVAMIDRGRLVEGMVGPLDDVKRGFGKNSILLEFEGNGSFLADLPGVARIDAYGRISEIRLEQDCDPQAVLHAAAARLKIVKFEIMMPTLHNIFIEKAGIAPASALKGVGDA